MFVPPANIGGGKVSTFVPSAAEADTKTEDASSSSVPLAPQGNSTSKESSSVEDTSTDKTDKHQPGMSIRYVANMYTIFPLGKNSMDH